MPRGRTRKVGQRRIDAALDALRPLGFKEKCVIRTVHRLLKVYGGETGWVFIEEGSYKLLIDTLIEDQEKADSHEVQAGELKLDETLTAETVNKDSGAGPSSEDRVANPQSTDTSNFDREKTYPEPEISATIKTSSPLTQVESISWKDISCLNYAESSDTIQQYGETREAPIGLHVGGSEILVKRKPCFGWLEDDDDDESFERKRVSRWDV